jgi:ribonucleoside-diphosphate reductase subunit M2
MRSSGNKIRHMPRRETRIGSMEGRKGIFEDDPQRCTVFPIRYPELWRFYKQAVAGFWTP